MYLMRIKLPKKIPPISHHSKLFRKYMIAIEDNIVKAKITVEDFRIPIKDISRDHTD